MSMCHRRALERIELLRLLVRYFDLTSDSAGGPQAHTKLLGNLRNQLAQLEMEEDARSNVSLLFRGW